MPAVDVTPERFELFLFISINIEHKKNTFFIRMLLQIYINNDTSIIIDPNNNLADESILVKDDIKINQLLTEKISSTCNQALVAVICLFILCYTWSKCSNI